MRSFYFSPRKINGSNSKSISACIILRGGGGGGEKRKRFILSSSLLLFSGLFAPIGEIAHERMHVLSVISCKKKARHKTRHMSRPVFSCRVHNYYSQ